MVTGRRVPGLLVGSAVFTFAGVIQRGLPILLLPLYASALSPAEYGKIAVLIAATTLLASITSLGLEAWVVRETVRRRDDPASRAEFLNSIGWLMLLGPAIVACAVGGVAAVTAADWISPVLVFAAAMAIALQTTLTVFVGAVLRADHRLRGYVAITLVHAGVTATATIGLLFALHAGPLGWFAGAVIGAASALVFGLAILGHRWSGDVSRSVIRAALLFGLPLVPHALAHWVLNFSDRVVLGAFADDAVVGVYNVAYQAAAPIMLVLIGVHQGVMPLYPRALEDGAVRARLATILTGHVHLASWLGATAALLAPPVLVALFPHAYRGAVEFVPWISLGYVFFGLYLIPMDSMTLMLGRSRWLWIPTALAATTNVAINLALVPRYGALASAAATAIAYGVLLAGVIVARQQTAGARISYDVRSMVVGVSWVILLAVGAGTLFPSLENVASIAGRVLVVAIAGAGLLAWQRWPSLAPERDHGASQAAENVHADERIEVKATHV